MKTLIYECCWYLNALMFIDVYVHWLITFQKVSCMTSWRVSVLTKRYGTTWNMLLNLDHRHDPQQHVVQYLSNSLNQTGYGHYAPLLIYRVCRFLQQTHQQRFSVVDTHFFFRISLALSIQLYIIHYMRFFFWIDALKDKLLKQ